MVHDLSVSSGETYRVDTGTTETHASANVDGTLDIDGQLILTGEEPRAVTVTDDISLPMSIEFTAMNMGIALFLVGILGLQLAASVVLRNWLAGVMWSVSFILLLMAGVFGLGLELFWMAVIATLILLILGMIIQWIG